MDNWKKAGLIGLGALLGVLLSLNFSAVAQREAKLPIPYEDLQLLSAVFGLYIIIDWFKIESSYSEEALTSSREGELEAMTEQHKI